MPRPTPARPQSSWTADDLGPDPFGQAGVRQYFGKALMWVCLVAALLSTAMWYRSSFFFDNFDWRGKGQSLRVRSLHSRVMIDYSADTADRVGLGGTGWSYSGGYTRRVQDGWRDSLWKSIGVEFRSAPLDRNAAGGFWLRIKWHLIVLALLIVPAVRGSWIAIRRAREARE